MEEDTNPLTVGKRAQISAGQPRSAKLPPMVADFSSVARFSGFRFGTNPMFSHVQIGEGHCELLEVAGDSFEVAVGMPWACETFIAQACRLGHPALEDMGVPPELEAAVQQNAQWSELQLSNCRIAWCRKWMMRASELEAAERESANKRHPVVAEITSEKRLLLTEEMLNGGI